ncbi:MAG: SMP-30/gluconolactonase/LRE family protein [Phycisphaerae bacterium]|nr:SMP-30/gluconolactonase/LRE family protein [Phycisphaerae bacterium]
MAATLREPACVVPAGDWCGEAPVWHFEEHALYWADINRFLIHRFDSCSGCVKTWLFEEPVTALGLTDRENTLLVALGSRLIFWDPATGERTEHGFQLAGWPRVRLNDGRPDPRGSFWVGSMRNNVGPEGKPGECGGTDGALFRIDATCPPRRCREGIGIANTLAWSPDQTRFYFADSLANTVWEYCYDPGTGDISGERPFLAGYPRGVPDGSAMDREGYLWNCRHGGGCIVRVAPAGGIAGTIEMPVPNVTSCTFGGEDYRTLYVTTAALGAPPHRFAGGLFAVRTETPGLPENRFAIDGPR